MGRKTAIGLDIGSSCVRAAEVRIGHDGAGELIHFGQVALPTGAVVQGEVHDQLAVTAAIATLWSAVRFGHRRVVLGIASPSLAIRQVEVPYFKSLKELRSALPLIVGDQVPLDPTEAVLDFAALEEIRNGDGSREIGGLLVAGLESVVTRYVDSVMAAGLRPTAVDLNPFALLRSCVPASGLGLATRPEAVVDIGADLTSIVIHENGMPRFVRILSVAGQSATRSLMDDLGLSLPEAEACKREFQPGERADAPSRVISAAAAHLVEEVRGTVDYYAATSANGPVTELTISGGGSLLAGLAELLSDRLRIPVGRARGLRGLSVGRAGLSDAQLRFVDPVSAVPVGLAMGAPA